MEILEFFKYLQYVRLAQMRQTPKLTMILLWEHEFGSNESNFPHMSFLPTNLTFRTRTYINNFSNSPHIEHFLSASTRNWCISNILREIDCSSKIKGWTYMYSWQHLGRVRPRSWSEVKKSYSGAGLDRELKRKQKLLNFEFSHHMQHFEFCTQESISRIYS